MAATINYTDLLTMSRGGISKNIEDQFAPIVSNMATNRIWYAYDWRQSLTELPPFYLVPNEQDHNLPLVVTPTDFHGLRKAQICHYYQNGIGKDDLGVVKDLMLTQVKALPDSISYEPTASGFRLFPRVPDNIGAPFWFVEGTYKKKPVKITNTTLATTFPFDDLYVNVAIEVFRWAYFSVANDPRAGEVQMNGSQVVYSGQLAKAMAAIEEMATNEGLNDGDVRISPAEALAYGGGSGFSPGFGVW